MKNRVNITFLVGNGFDISAGLNTSYSSFYKWFINQKNEDKDIQDFKKRLKQDLEEQSDKWSDFEIGLGQYTKEYSIDNIDAFIKSYENAHEMIVKYIEEEVSKKDLKKISQQEIVDFRQGILEYYKELTPQEIKIFEGLNAAHQTEDDQVRFLSFNYSETLDYYVKQCANLPPESKKTLNRGACIIIKPSIIHIHGTTSLYPALGVNDNSQIENEMFKNNQTIKEIMIKPESVRTVGQLWHVDAERIIDESQIICIWGISLGETDKKWWKKITSWLASNKKHKLIIFWYETDIINNISVYNRIRVVQMVKEHFLSFSTIPSDKKINVEEQIHIVINPIKVLKVKIPEKKYPSTGVNISFIPSNVGSI